MPSYWNEDFETFEQDWEPVVLKKDKNSNNNTQPQNNQPIPLYRQIANARSINNYTQHQFAQILHMKVNKYIKIEAGTIEVPPEIIPKLRKYLKMKI